jgi:SHS2 domain-containing protein
MSKRSAQRGEAERRNEFAFVEGATSDVSFEARGATLEALFASAAEALLAATVANPEDVAAREREPIALSEPDVELLLLRFLNELVFLRDARGLLLRAGRLRIEHNGEARLEGELLGERIDRSRHRLEADVKAATASGLRVARDGAGWRASVTLDV